MCSLEANWVTAGFAAPREGQEEPQEAGISIKCRACRSAWRSGSREANDCFEECHR